MARHELTFGEWLKDQIEARRLDQQAFAAAVGVGDSTVSNWVNDKAKPQRKWLASIAATLQVREYELYDALNPKAERTFREMSGLSALYDAEQELLAAQRRVDRALEMMREVMRANGARPSRSSASTSWCTVVDARRACALRLSRHNGLAVAFRMSRDTERHR